MANAVYQDMTPRAQDHLQVAMTKLAYWLQAATEALGGTGGTVIYQQMAAQAKDPLQVLVVKAAYWAEALAGSGGAVGGGVLFDSAAGPPPEDGSILKQGYIDTSTGDKFINTNWPNTAAPTWQPF